MERAGPISLRSRSRRSDPDRAYTTVLTILERLRRKKLVKRSTDGKVHTFERGGHPGVIHGVAHARAPR